MGGPLRALLEPSGGFLKASQDSPRCFLGALRKPKLSQQSPRRSNCKSGICLGFLGPLKALLEPSGGSHRPSRYNPRFFLRAQRGPRAPPPIPDTSQTLKLQVWDLCGIFGNPLRALLESSGGSLRSSQDDPWCFLRAPREFQEGSKWAPRRAEIYSDGHGPGRDLASAAPRRCFPGAALSGFASATKGK